MAGFTGRVAIVTGAGRGLGRAYARFLAAQGASVVVNNRRHAEDKSEGSADRVVHEIVRAGGVAVADYGDAADPSAGAHMVESTLARFGRLDILITNAAVTDSTTFRKQDLDDFRRVMETNFFGALAVAQPVFKAMYAARYGRILLTTSTAGLYGGIGHPAYSASKAALIGLMRVLALEGARRGVLTNAIAPYATTRMTEALTPAHLHAPLDPDKVAPVAAWLVSEKQRRSGEIVISGGGALRVARMMESGSVLLVDDGVSVEDQLGSFDAAGGFRPMASAPAEFSDFLGSLGLAQ